MNLMEKAYTLLAVLNVDPNIVPKVKADQSQLNNILNGAFMIAGAVSILFIIIGGYRYVTSQGESNAVKTAKEMIVYSLVGLVLVIVSFTIVQIVINVVGE